MPACTPIRSEVSIPNTRWLFAVSIVVAVVVFSVIAAARSPLETLELAGQSSAATFDRTRKGDRLLLTPAIPPTRKIQSPGPRRAPPADSKLARGCEPAVSPLANSELSTVAARCVS